MTAARFIDVWVNCPDRATAEAIAARAIADRLAACANVLPPIASLYHWKGKVEADEEVPLILKTQAVLFRPLCALVRALHPFETPSIVATPLPQLDADYAAWLAAETAPAAPAVAGPDAYRPRRARFHGMAACGALPVKLATVEADGAAVTPDDVAAAERTIAAAAEAVAGTDHRGAGFAVLHAGEEGLWLLLHWWLGGGILAHRVWRAAASGAAFAEADRQLVACVWELGVIEFERRAWMATAMAGGAVTDYLARTFPEGHV